jgi:hypothetical protein
MPTLQEQCYGVNADQVLREKRMHEVANLFIRVLTREIGLKKLAIVRERQAVERRPGICHSHDFCDANMVMQEAMEQLGLSWEKTFSADNEPMVNFWNESWDIAAAMLGKTTSAPGRAIRWETAPYKRPTTGRVADYLGHRLYVRREGRGKFHILIDGKSGGYGDTMDEAVALCERRFNAALDKKVGRV